MKMRPVGAESFHVDGQTETHTNDEVNSRFFEFCERTYKPSIVHIFNFKQVPSIITRICVGFLAF
jgi:hypothetical protein